MKTRAIILSVILALIIPSYSYCQVGNILKNRINKAINKKVEEKIDTAVNKRVEEAAKTQETSTRQQGNETTETREQGSINIGGLVGKKVTSKYNESYSFNNRMYMVTEIHDGKDVVNMDYNVYWNDNNLNGGIESKTTGTSEQGEQATAITKIVVDGDNKSMIMMTDIGAMRMGFISEIPDESTLPDQPEAKAPKQVITKTGNTRVVAGYKCDEYMVKETDSKDHGLLWCTNDFKLTMDKRAYSKSGLSSYYDIPELKDAIVLAMETYNGKNELELKSETKEINLGISHTISTAGYALRQINFNQAGTQQKK